MQVTWSSASPVETPASALAVGIFEQTELTGVAAAIDEATGGAVRRLMEHDEFTGKPLQSVTLYAAQGLPATRTVLVGLGPQADFNAQVAFRAAGTAAKLMAGKAYGKAALYFPAEHAEDAVAGAINGCVGQDLYRHEHNLHPFQELLVNLVNQDGEAASEDEIRDGQVIGDAIVLARELVNRPASEIYPESFAARAAEIAKATGLRCEIWDNHRLREEKCGALLAVAQGSQREPRMVILEHRGAAKDAPTLALVGKGVTFDSGGLSLKPSDSMIDMKSDMAGGATVVAAMQAIAALKLPVNVIGLVGLVENMISGSSFRLGDILTARNGKTIEVHNTDAEGRLVLADTLDVARERGAAEMIDLATLTGACLVALGVDFAGIMSNNDDLSQQVLDSAEEVGEQAWPLPMHRDFNDHIKSEVADIKNVGNGRWGGAITAAKFLEEFVGETPWVHVDIAGPSFYESPRAWNDAGASGVFVRTLVEVARRRVAKHPAVPIRV